MNHTIKRIVAVGAVFAIASCSGSNNQRSTSKQIALGTTTSSNTKQTDESSSFQLIPAGQYGAVMATGNIMESESSTDPMVLNRTEYFPTWNVKISTPFEIQNGMVDSALYDRVTGHLPPLCITSNNQKYPTKIYYYSTLATEPCLINARSTVSSFMVTDQPASDQVVFLNHQQAAEFAEKVTSVNNDGCEYRLPTNAEVRLAKLTTGSPSPKMHWVQDSGNYGLPYPSVSDYDDRRDNQYANAYSKTMWGFDGGHSHYWEVSSKKYLQWPAGDKIDMGMTYNVESNYRDTYGYLYDYVDDPGFPKPISSLPPFIDPVATGSQDSYRWLTDGITIGIHYHPDRDPSLKYGPVTPETYPGVRLVRICNHSS